MKKIEDYGGFDNYIEKCPAEKSKSNYHSLLKQILIEKKNDPKMEYFRSPDENKIKNIKKHA